MLLTILGCGASSESPTGPASPGTGTEQGTPVPGGKEDQGQPRPDGGTSPESGAPGTGAPPQQSRADWVNEQIEAHDQGLSPQERQEKHEAMASSAMAFYRATNYLFWHDLAQDPRLSLYGSSQTKTWIQGDLHVGNWGAYDNDQGKVVYNLNDFDEAIIADYQLDLWRMATSLVLQARANGFSASDTEQLLSLFAQTYSETLKALDGNSNEKTFELTSENAYGLLDDFLKDVESNQSRKKMLKEWTSVKDNKRQLDTSNNPNLQAVSGAIEQGIKQAFTQQYGRTLSGGLPWDPDYFKIKSVAKRLHAGVASLGQPRYYVLIEGKSHSLDDDRILDIKYEPAPTGYGYLSTAERQQYDTSFTSHAERSARGYKALCVHVDDHLGWIEWDGAAYRVTERSPYKADLDLAQFNTMPRMSKLVEQWAKLLATDHARADSDADASVIGYSFEQRASEAIGRNPGGFESLVRAVAVGYADQVEQDYGAFAGQFQGEHPHR